MPSSVLENELLDKSPASDELADLKRQLKQQKNQINHLKRDLKKAKYRINTLKLQKGKLLKKLKSPNTSNSQSISFFKKPPLKK